MSNEVKVAILAIVAVALFYWGYKFVRGKNILGASNIYYVEYNNVDQLKMSSPVLINGFQIGFVADIYLKPDNYEKIIVKLDLDKEIRIPADTRAIIKDTGFMGGKAIVLQYDQPCSGDQCAASGSYLEGGRMGLLDSMVGEEALEDYIDILKKGLKDVIDTLNRELLSEEAEGPLAESLRDLSSTLENLKLTTGQLNSLLASSSDDIDGTLSNLRSITGTIEASNDKIEGIIDNADRLTSELAEANLKKSLEEVDQAVAQLSGTLQTADEALLGVSAAVDKINQGEGTLGKLLADEELYNNLNSLSRQTDSLIEDFQERPYRYMPFKSRRKVKKFDRRDAKLEAAKENAAAGGN
jgi:phospholipid/cholesterol/gamma-HCH transport system substrate-binding protein